MREELPGVQESLDTDRDPLGPGYLNYSIKKDTKQDAKQGAQQMFCFVLFIPRLWVTTDGSCSQLRHKRLGKGGIQRIKGGGQINCSTRHPQHIPTCNSW